MAAVRPRVIAKLLSPNDVGETGTHQAGIVVPKTTGALAFFPVLDPKEKNPRYAITACDTEGRAWKLNFIYYNNGLFGGTRNEYRLTGLTRFFRENGVKPADELRFRRSTDGQVHIELVRAANGLTPEGKLKLGTSWRIIQF
jgi:hypothetical protein